MANVNIGAEISALPLGFVLSAPLTAAIEAQALSAANTVDFVNKMGTDDFGNLRTMVFKYNHSITDPNTGDAEVKTVDLTVPLLSMVEAPHIAIEDLTVGFEFHIRDVTSRDTQFRIAATSATEYAVENETSANVNGSVGGLLGFLGVKGGASINNTTRMKFKSSLTVSAAYQSSTRQETDRRATLKLNMNAKQRVPEGFQRVLGIFADAITAQVPVP
jgi:hypothetical protein